MNSTPYLNPFQSQIQPIPLRGQSPTDQRPKVDLAIAYAVKIHEDGITKKGEALEVVKILELHRRDQNLYLSKHGQISDVQQYPDDTPILQERSIEIRAATYDCALPVGDYVTFEDDPSRLVFVITEESMWPGQEQLEVTYIMESVCNLSSDKK